MTAAGPVEVVTARTAAELERLRTRWERVPWEREEAELDYLLARVRLRPEAIAPLGVLVCRDGEPLSGLAGRVEERRLPARLGYLAVVAPRLRLLHVVQGGIVGTAAIEALRPLLGEVDAVVFPPLPVDSDLARAAAALASPLRRQPFVAAGARRVLALPASYEEFLASRSRKVRFGLRYDAKKLLAALGPDLRTDVVREPAQLETLVRDLDAVARLAYQRALGGGFTDTLEQRELLRLALERGWARVFLLRHRGRPIAYWLCSVYRGTMLLRQTGFDPGYAHLRVGIFLLTQAIGLAIADPAIEVIDFGQGDAAYKRQLSSESWLEREVVVFAPTWRGLRANAARAPVLGAARLARRALDAASLTDRVRVGWRSRARR